MLVPPEKGRMAEDVDAALIRLIDVQLQSQGVMLDSDQVRALKQEGPVLQFLDKLVELGRHRLEAARRSASTGSIDPDLDPSPSGETSLSPVDAKAQPTGPTDAVASSQPMEAASDTTPVDPPVEAAPVPTPVRKTMRLMRLPNGTAGLPYDQVIDPSKAWGSPVRVVGVDRLDGTGLQFDTVAWRLYGTPEAEPGKSREMTIPIKIDEGSQLEDAAISIFINPDPRSLWKEIEPDGDLPFQKPHRRSAANAGGGLRAVAASVRGRSHANNGTFREDDFDLCHDASGTWTVIAVSDGAGSAKLSRRGSELAAQRGVAELAAALGKLETGQALPEEAELSAGSEALGRMKHVLLDPVGRAAFLASKAIQAEADKLGVQEKLLSATLLLAAVRRYGDGLLVASYWIGDGAAVLFDPRTGALEPLGDADSGEYSGQTRFLLSSEFAPDPWEAIKRRFRCRWVPAGAVLVLMSDGVSDPKFGTENALKDAARWKSWWHDDFIGGGVDLGADDASLQAQMLDYLGFWSQGEHDDRTLAVVY